MSNYADIPVLVVDDHMTMIKIVENLLREVGFNDISNATDGVKALDRIAQKKFELIISDWNMPNMTGLELLKKVRSSEGYLKTIPFILVTAESKAENIIAAKQAGVNNYIIKPLNAKTLKSKIDAVLGGF